MSTSPSTASQKEDVTEVIAVPANDTDKKQESTTPDSTTASNDKK